MKLPFTQEGLRTDSKDAIKDKERLPVRLKRALLIGIFATGVAALGTATAHAEEAPAPEIPTVTAPANPIDAFVDSVNTAVADTQGVISDTLESTIQSAEEASQATAIQIEQSIAQAQESVPVIEDKTPENPIAVGDVVVAIASPEFDRIIEDEYGNAPEENPNDSKFDGSKPFGEQVVDAAGLFINVPVQPNHHSDIADGEATTKETIERTLADIEDTVPEDRRQTFETTEVIYMPRFSPGYITISPEDYAICLTRPGNTSYCDGVIRTSDGLLNIRPDALEVEGYGTELTDEEKREAIDAVLTAHEYGHADDDRKMRELTGVPLHEFVGEGVDRIFAAEQSGDNAARIGLDRMVQEGKLTESQRVYAIEWIKYHSFEGEPTHGGPAERGGQLYGTATPAPTPLEYAIAHSMGMTLK